MKFLANENFPFASIDILNDPGFDIISIAKKYPGIDDETVMKIAINENRIILTFDSDYGTLVFEKGYKPLAGIIYFRWQSFSPGQPGEFLKTLLQTKQYRLKGFFTVIGIENLRQRIIK